MLSLEATNKVLRAGQINPVASLSSPDRFTTRAIAILEQEKLRVLEKGWDFNTDYEYVLSESGGAIAVPTDALAIDIWPQNSGKDVVARSGYLYNKTDNTAVWATGTTIKAEIVRDITFDNLPPVMQTYIVDCACLEFAITVTVDAQTAGQLREAKQRSWEEVKRRDTTQASYNPRRRGNLAYIASRWFEFPGGGSTSW